MYKKKTIWQYVVPQRLIWEGYIGAFGAKNIVFCATAVAR